MVIFGSCTYERIHTFHVNDWTDLLIYHHLNIYRICSNVYPLLIL